MLGLPQPDPRSSRPQTGELYLLGLIVVIAVIIRVAWLARAPVDPESDYATFYAMARLIADGEWRPQDYGWVYQGAGFPTLLAPLIWLGGGVDAIRVVNLVAQVAMVALVSAFAWRLFGRVPALAAGLCAAVLPGIWSYTPLVAAESVAMLLLVGVGCALAHPTGLRSAASAGALAGLLAFTRPAFLPFVLVCGLVVMLCSRAPRWQRPAAFSGGLLLVAAPFLLMNVASGGPALPTGAAGWQTWLVNNERSTGAWFAAAARDDYPFAGLLTDTEMRAAQQRLGLQFMVVNPVETLERFIERHRMNWQADDLGIFWTLDRLPRGPWAGPADTSHYHDLANVAYTALVVLAVIGAWRQRNHGVVLIPLVLPLLYGMAVLSAAEANGRYHVVFLPLLCLFAGAALQTVNGDLPRRAACQAAGILGKAALVTLALHRVGPWGAGEEESILSWLVLLVVAIPIVGVTVTVGPGWWARMRGSVWGRGWRLRAELAVIGATTVLMGSLVLSTVTQLREEVAAVAPSGWRAYVAVAGHETIVPLVAEPADVPADLVQVSYPDAVQLTFDGHAAPGQIAGLRRELDGLAVGEAYLIAIQIYDPQMSGDPGEVIRLLIDGVPVWELPVTAPGAGMWHAVRVEWTATAPMMVLDVQRVAGSGTVVTAAGTPKVRTLLLLPKP